MSTLNQIIYPVRLHKIRLLFYVYGHVPYMAQYLDMQTTTGLTPQTPEFHIHHKMIIATREQQKT